MNKYLIFFGGMLFFLSCQKSAISEKVLLSTEEKTTYANKIISDQIFINYLNTIVAGQEIVKEACKNPDFKIKELQNIQNLTFRNDEEFLVGLKSVNFNQAEQYISNRNDQKMKYKAVEQKYPALDQFTLEEWNLMSSTALKNIYSSQGKKYYSRI